MTSNHHNLLGRGVVILFAAFVVSNALAQRIDPPLKSRMDALLKTEACLLGPACSSARLANTGPVAVTGITVVNAATFLPGLSPGSWVTIFGASLANNTRS